MENILHLTINKQWFDLIDSGIKKEEYRDIKKYWFDRLVFKGDKVIRYLGLLTKDVDLFNKQLDFIVTSTLSRNMIGFIPFDQVEFTNGYNKQSRKITVKCLGIEIKRGETTWGAVEDKFYFTIKLGDIINRVNF